MFMRRILAAGVAGALLVAGAVSANAADLPTLPAAPPPPPPAPVAPAFDWSGPYVGAYGGVLNIGPTYGQAGIQAGFNVTRGNFLAGIEGQIGAIFAGGGVALETDLNARLGFILGERVLLYGEAGVLYIPAAGPPPFWTAGGGLEFAVGDRASIFAEAKVLGTFGGGCCGYVAQGGLNFHIGN